MKRINFHLKARHWVLIILLVIVTLFRTIPGWGGFYTLHVYPLIGTVLSHISGVFPFAVGDIFIACSIAWCILFPIYEIGLRKRLAKRFIFLRPKSCYYPKKKAVFGRVAEYLLWVYAWFYLAWGLNYSQPNIYYRIGMMPAKVDKAQFKEFAYRYADSLNALSEERRVKSSLSEERREKSEEYLKAKTAEEILKGYNALNTDENLRNQNLDRDAKSTRTTNPYIGINPPFNDSPRVKTMVFSRLSSMAGVTGSMGPFFCEFTLNGEVRPHDYPSTYAHEFAHFLGIANEGEANFYSYIVCTAASDKMVKFSGYYHIFFHVLANVYDILGEQEGEKFLKHIRPEIIQLARSDRKYWLDKRCKALDDAQDFIFDLYLRGNHVAEGRKSYSGVIGLILAWEAAASRFVE